MASCVHALVALLSQVTLADLAATMEMVLLEAEGCLERSPNPAGHKNQNFASHSGTAAQRHSDWKAHLSDFPPRSSIFAHDFAIHAFGNHDTLHVCTVGLGHELLAQIAQVHSQEQSIPKLKGLHWSVS